MSRTTARHLMNDAHRNGYCVGAFNVTSLVQMRAIVETACNRKSPAIIQTSVTPARFFGPAVLATAYRLLAEQADVPLALQLDHCRDIELCRHCIDVGYTSIMFDGSHLPFEENVSKTRAVVDYARLVGGTSVEGELGLVGGVEDEIHADADTDALCPPDQVVDFVKRTGIDVMAPAIGTAHGIYKSSNPRVDIDRFRRIEGLLNGKSLMAPLVVHGGTGLPDDTVQRLVGYKAAKFNVSTELKHSLIDTTYDYIGAHRTDYNPGAIDGAVNTATAEVVGRWMDKLGSTGAAMNHSGGV